MASMVDLAWSWGESIIFSRCFLARGVEMRIESVGSDCEK